MIKLLKKWLRNLAAPRLPEDVVHRLLVLHDCWRLGAHRLNLLKHLIDGYTIEDDEPQVGSIRWTNLHIVYAGTDYAIIDGYTDKKYAWWDYSVSTTTLQTTDTLPTLAEEDIIIFLNKNGTHATVPITTALDGSLIVTESILTAALSANCVTSEKILAGAVIAEKIAVETLAAITAYLGNVFSGTLTGTVIRTAVSGKRIIIDEDGIKLITDATTGKYSSFKYGDGTKYGTGYLARIHHLSSGIPFEVISEQNVGDFHFYNRSDDPTGAAKVGDMVVVQGKLKICTGAGTPGTWTIVGTQT